MRVIIAAALLGGALLVNAGTAAAASCFGVPATIVGTKHNDHIRGTSGRDVIAGLGGDDTISSLGNSDRICGNGGNDKLLAGPGVDKLAGGSGRNVLKGGAGDDRLYGGPSVDSFWPGSGDDVVRSGGTGSREWVHYENAPGPMHIDLDSRSANGFGTDLLFAVLDVSGSRFGDVIKGNEADNVLKLGPGNDHGVGRGGSDKLLGGPGADDLDGGPGANTNDGGDGNDHCLNPDPVSGALHCESPTLTSAIPPDPWNPSMLGPNLVHWWDASDTSTMVFDSVSGKLTEWADKAGGSLAKQATDSARPSVTGGEVRFSGAQSMTLPGMSRAYIENAWFLALFRIDWASVTSTEGSLFAVNGYSGSPGMRQPYFGYTLGDQNVNVQWKNSLSANTIKLPAPGDDVWHSFLARRSEDGYFASIDGGPEVALAGNPAQNLFGGPGIIGDFRGASNWGLDTLLIGQRELTAADVQKLHAWALWRRGSQSVLPESSPYKTSKPPAEPPIVEAPDGEGTPGFDWSLFAWDDSHKSEPLDLTGFTLTFEDDFNSISTITDGVSGAGPWYAPARPDTSVARFRSPTQTPTTFTIDTPSVLTIKMQNVNGTWYSGHIQTVNTFGHGFAQQYGYFEAKMAFNKAVGWPAFWLYSQSAYKDTAQTNSEIDVIEAYGDNDYDGYHMAVHRHPASRPQPGHLQSDARRGNYSGLSQGANMAIRGWNDMFDGQFHRYGVLVKPDWIIVYLDGLELSRIQTYPEAKTPHYMLVSLQMQDEFKAQATSPTYLWVDWVRAYALPGS